MRQNECGFQCSLRPDRCSEHKRPIRGSESAKACEAGLDNAARLALDVHIAEYNALRELVTKQIDQDRYALNLGITVLVALVASLGAVTQIQDISLRRVFWLIPAVAPGLLAIIGFMNARSIQAGLEVNAYIVYHLIPSISELIGRHCRFVAGKLLRSEHFFPRVDRLHELKRRHSVTETEGPVRKWSGVARASLFVAPSILCVIAVLVGSTIFSESRSGLKIILPLSVHLWNYFVICIWALTAVSLAANLAMMRVYLVLRAQLLEYWSWTSYEVRGPGKE